MEADVQKGVDLVQRFYLAEGYLDAKVSPPVMQFTKDRTRANISMAIAEGQRYPFGNVTIEGNLIFPEPQVRGLIADQIPLPYTEPRVDSMQRKLEDYYKRQATSPPPSPRTATRSTPTPMGRVAAAFTVNPGPLYHFDGARIVGTDRLKPQYLRNRFSKLSGKVYSPKALDEVYQDMIRTGLFSQLRVTPPPQDGRHAAARHRRRRKQKARDLGFSLGYGTFEGPIVGFEVRDRDFNGTGRPDQLSVDYSTRTLSGAIALPGPVSFRDGQPVAASRFRLCSGRSMLTTRGRSTAWRRSRARSPSSSRWARSRWRRATPSPTSMSAPRTPASPITKRIRSAQRSSLDYRDSPVAPTKGLITDAAVDIARALSEGPEFSARHVSLHLFPAHRQDEDDAHRRLPPGDHQADGRRQRTVSGSSSRNEDPKLPRSAGGLAVPD